MRFPLLDGDSGIVHIYHPDSIGQYWFLGGMPTSLHIAYYEAYTATTSERAIHFALSNITLICNQLPAY